MIALLYFYFQIKSTQGFGEFVHHFYIYAVDIQSKFQNILFCLCTRMCVRVSVCLLFVFFFFTLPFKHRFSKDIEPGSIPLFCVQFCRTVLAFMVDVA